MTSLEQFVTAPTFPQEYVWEQKYRSKTLADVALPDGHRKAFEGFIEKRRLPSLLFYSPSPGTGKTTTARALSAEIGCPKPMFINASLNSSIDVIREQVIQYGQTVSLHGVEAQKVVILDEAERLSKAAQESLKGLMEQFSKTCAFILTTNDINRLEAPLQSRCRRYDFVWTVDEALQVKTQILKRVIGVLNNEGVPFEANIVSAVVNRNFPDNRSLLGGLHAYAEETGRIDAEILNRVGGYNFNGLIEILREKDFKKASAWAMDNHQSMQGGIFGAMFRFLVPFGDESTEYKIAPTGVPALAVLLNEAQRPKNIGVDGFVHLLATLVELMNNTDIKVV